MLHNCKFCEILQLLYLDNSTLVEYMEVKKNTLKKYVNIVYLFVVFARVMDIFQNKLN